MIKYERIYFLCSVRKIISSWTKERWHFGNANNNILKLNLLRKVEGGEKNIQ